MTKPVRPQLPDDSIDALAALVRILSSAKASRELFPDAQEPRARLVRRVKKPLPRQRAKPRGS